MQEIESKFTYILSTVNDWLRFAEAKNAALLVFASAIIAGILSFIGSSQALPSSWMTGLFTAIGTLAVSCLICMASFIPKVNRLVISKARKGVCDKENDNLLFFGDLCKYTSEELLDAASLSYFQETSAPSRNRFCFHIADQIVINSRIAVSKYKLFKLALLCSMASFPAVLIGTLLHTVFSKQ